MGILQENQGWREYFIFLAQTRAENYRRRHATLSFGITYFDAASSEALPDSSGCFGVNGPLAWITIRLDYIMEKCIPVEQSVISTFLL